MKKGVIIIRDMTAYGLPKWIRVSIGTMEQNRRFLAELEALSVPGGGVDLGSAPNCAVAGRQIISPQFLFHGWSFACEC